MLKYFILVFEVSFVRFEVNCQGMSKTFENKPHVCGSVSLFGVHDFWCFLESKTFGDEPGTFIKISGSKCLSTTSLGTP